MDLNGIFYFSFFFFTTLAHPVIFQDYFFSELNFPFFSVYTEVQFTVVFRSS